MARRISLRIALWSLLLVTACVCLASAGPADRDLRTLMNPTTPMAENRYNPGEGSPVAGGDLNGDGRSDIVVSAPRAANEVQRDSGAVYVWFGRTFGDLAPITDLEKFLDVTLRNDPLSTDLLTLMAIDPSQGIQLMPERGGHFFGATLATGDFNGDGFDDLAVAEDDPILSATISSIYIAYGYPGRQGLTYIADDIDAGYASEIRGRSVNARFGQAMLFRDFNNDGRDELVIASPNEGTGGVIDILWGKPAVGLDPPLPMRVGIDDTQLSATMIVSTVPGELFGTSLAAGPLQAGGNPLLFVGAPLYPSPEVAAGRILGYQLSLVNDDRLAGALRRKEWRALNPQMGVGFSLATGQFFGFNAGLEIVAGAPFENTAQGAQAGAVYMMTMTLAPANDIGSIPPAIGEGAVLYGASAEDRFGTTIALGNVDNTFGDEVIIGAPGVNGGGLPDSGAIYAIPVSRVPSSMVFSDAPGTPTFLRVVGFKPNFRAGSTLALLENFDNILPDTLDLVVGSDGKRLFPPGCVDPLGPAEDDFCYNQREGTRWVLIRGGILDVENIARATAPDAWMQME